MLYSKAKELTRAEQLMGEGKFEEALQLLDELGKNKALSHNEQISYYILRSTLSMYLFRYFEILKYAEKAYQKSQNLGISIKLLDVYIHMAIGLEYQYKLQESFEFLGKAENLLKTLTEESPTELTKRKASISYLKGWLYHDQGEHDRALKFAQLGLEMQEKIDIKAEIGLFLWQIGWIYSMSDNELALKCVEQAIKYGEKISYHFLIQKCYQLKGLIYLSRGELEQALSCFKLSKTQYEELSEVMKDDLGFAKLLHIIGMVYYEKDDLETAKNHFEEALKIKKKLRGNLPIVVTLDSLITLTLEQNDLKSAEILLKNMKQISDKEEYNLINLLYRVNRAKLLKFSPLVSNQAKAEEILKKCMEDKLADNEAKIMILINLSDLLLVKLRETNDLKLLDELQLYATRIHDIAKVQQSYSSLAENFLLQAKLKLLSFDLKAAQLSLTQARQICEKYGLNRIKLRVSREKEELSKQLDKWEELKKSETNLSVRMDLAGLGNQVNRMLKKRSSLARY